MPSGAPVWSKEGGGRKMQPRERLKGPEDEKCSQSGLGVCHTLKILLKNWVLKLLLEVFFTDSSLKMCEIQYCYS